ncbi:hypothetical protein E3U43_012792 [Larimichthys crocea]|uniref:Uncharacterized protein n=1 Tax=Larimichthys crocea TaxID=215358 RepID=A0ACD3RT57_LARCR|nr:hypothetical protein E3U43_012792 [Larimichthys crocea]
MAHVGFCTCLITAEEEKKHRLTEEQPKTVTTKKNKLSTTSAQRVLFYMHSVDQCTQSLKKSTHCFHLQLLTPRHFKYTATRGRWSPNSFRFSILGSKVKQESLISTRKSEKQKIQNSVDCAFDYFRVNLEGSSS